MSGEYIDFNKVCEYLYGAHIQPRAAHHAHGTLHIIIPGHLICSVTACTISTPRGSIQHCNHLAL